MAPTKTYLKSKLPAHLRNTYEVQRSPLSRLYKLVHVETGWVVTALSDREITEIRRPEDFFYREMLRDNEQRFEHAPEHSNADMNIFDEPVEGEIVYDP